MTKTTTETVQPEEHRNNSRLARLAHWFDTRLGLSHELFRPVPQYAINPFYWLGALAVTAFIIEGVTGVIMMLYYVPSPTQAYASTLYIFNTVSYGRFLETVHLYTAYAMIMLTFMHMMRGYFVSVHKRPREIMWVVGMLMGFVTLGFGFTGYLLPWTLVSKSATDVGVGMINALPAGLSSFLSFLIVGAGSDATELLRFYDLHVVVLPAVLLGLLAAKMYMLETHGISDPIAIRPLSQRARRLIPVFPDATFYLLELAALFGAGMLILSVVFPLNLPPEYSPAAAASYTAQPDWYFLWIYQILKISIFETAGLPVALAAVTIILALLVVLPFIDRSEKRSFRDRPFFVSLGLIFAVEVVILAVWGLLTPGQVIPDEQAALILGGTILVIVAGVYVFHRLFYSRFRSNVVRPVNSPTLRSTQAWTASIFVGLVALGSVAIGGLLNATTGIVESGYQSFVLLTIALSLAGLGIAVLGAIVLLYRLGLGANEVKRRIRFLEIGWGDE